MKIRKWSVYTADLSPRFAAEPGKLRSVVVVQTNLLNDAEHPSTLICPTTTKITHAKWLRVHLHRNDAGLSNPSDVLIDQLRAIDNRRLKKELGVLSKPQQTRMAECLRVILDLE
ncbi:MAG: taxon MazF [Omnitrophica bacterium GWA2_52_12]|nr:MAG: taxon MazF [Omnitrophica bacterium GWA2_52_12]